MNPDPDATRVVRAEAFGREVGRRVARGYSLELAQLEVALLEPHLACAKEQLEAPPERHAEILARWFPLEE